MSKDLAIASVMVTACLVVSAIAFVPPAKDSKDSKNPTTSVTTARRPLDGSQSKPPQSGLTPTRPVDSSRPNPFDASTSPFDQPSRPAPAFTPPPAAPVVAAPVVELPVLPANDEPKSHVIAKGEMLGDISLKYYGTSKRWQEIAKANPGIDPNGLRVGQKLVIPADRPKPVETASVEPAAPGERTYTVKDGDRYYTIAQRELGDASRWKEIETLNKTPSEELRVGQVIKLPVKKDASSTTAATDRGTPAEDGQKRHAVAEGETLGEISMKHYGTSKRWKEIEKANPGIDAERLYVGQKLIIPGVADTPKPDSATTSNAPTAAVSPAASDVTEYTVKAGDTLSAIADRLYHDSDQASVEKIQKANPGIDPNGLRVGQKLKVPGVKPEPRAVETAPAPINKPNPFTPAAPVNSAPNPFTSTAPSGPNQALPRTQPTSPFGQSATTPRSPAVSNSPAGAQPMPGPTNAPAPTRPTAVPPAPTAPTTNPDPFALDPLAPVAPPADPAAPASGTQPAPGEDPFIKDFFAR